MAFPFASFTAIDLTGFSRTIFLFLIPPRLVSTLSSGANARPHDHHFLRSVPPWLASRWVFHLELFSPPDFKLSCHFLLCLGLLLLKYPALHSRGNFRKKLVSFSYASFCAPSRVAALVIDYAMVLYPDNWGLLASSANVRFLCSSVHCN